MPQAKSEAKPETKPQAKSEAKPERVALVSMSNGTDTIEVNPLCVQDHERMGWKRAASAAE